MTFYSKNFERMKSKQEIISKTKTMLRKEVEEYLKKLNIDYWYPEDVTFPDNHYQEIKNELYLL